jgi:hypothetical protein
VTAGELPLFRLTSALAEVLAGYPQERPVVQRRLATAVRHAEAVDDARPVFDLIGRQAADPADPHRKVWRVLADLVADLACTAGRPGPADGDAPPGGAASAACAVVRRGQRVRAVEAVGLVHRTAVDVGASRPVDRSSSSVVCR